MLGLTAAESATDAAINKKIHGYETTIIVSNDEMNNILEIVKSLKDSGLLLKGVSGKIKNEVKEQSGGFLSMLLGTLASSLLTDMLLNKKGKGVIRAGEGTIRAGYGSKKIESSPINKF